MRYRCIREDTVVFTRTGNPAQYQDLVAFVEAQAKVLLNPRYGERGKVDDDDNKGHEKRSQYRRPPTKPVFKVLPVGEESQRCSYCKGEHQLKECKKMKKFSVSGLTLDLA